MIIYRILIALCVNVILLGAYDFKHCQAFYKQASLKSGGVALKVLPKGVYLYYSKTYPKHAKVLKSDPFIGLYLLQGEPSKFAYEMRALDKMALERVMVGISYYGAKSGDLVALQQDYTNYARFSQPTEPNGVISNICYQMLGLTIGGTSFIQTRYIKRFLNQKKPYYGDIGVRLKENKGLIVGQFDPFFTHNPFKKGDEIISINKHAIKTHAQFAWIVSNLKYHSLARVVIRRNKRIKEVVVRVNRRYGGFLLKDTFLERYHIKLDKDFIVVALGKNLPKGLNMLRIGDKILWVNRHKIALNDKALREALSSEKIELLVSRNRFEFYLKIR